VDRQQPYIYKGKPVSDSRLKGRFDYFLLVATAIITDGPRNKSWYNSYVKDEEKKLPAAPGQHGIMFCQ